MNFENQFPEWKNEGVEPDTSLKNEGFKGGYKPPAGIFNWFWSKVMKSTKEIQDKVSEIDEDKLSIISKSNSEWNQDNEPIPEGVLAYNTTERRAMIGDGNTQMTSYLNNIGQNIGPNTIAGEYGTCYGIGNSTDSSSNHTHIKGSLNRSTNSKFSNLRGASLSVTNSFNSQLMGERNAVDSSNYSSVFGLKSEANASGYALLNGVSNNAASSPYSFLNGNGHIATNSSYSILGGIGNKASNSGYAFMFGKNNTTDAENAEMAVTFGEKNVNNSTASFIAGGQRNTILNNGSTETGQAISYCSTILGGQNNVIFGKCGLAG